MDLDRLQVHVEELFAQEQSLRRELQRLLEVGVEESFDAIAQEVGVALSAHSAAVRDLRDHLSRLPEASGILSLPGTTGFNSLQQIGQFLNTIKKREREALLGKCLLVLEKVRAIEAVDSLDVPDLSMLRESAAELETTIRVSDGQLQIAAELSSGDHPFCALVRMVEMCRHLAPDEYFALQQRILMAFDGAVAATACRAQLRIRASALEEGDGCPRSEVAVRESPQNMGILASAKDCTDGIAAPQEPEFRPNISSIPRSESAGESRVPTPQTSANEAESSDGAQPHIPCDPDPVQSAEDTDIVRARTDAQNIMGVSLENEGRAEGSTLVAANDHESDNVAGAPDVDMIGANSRTELVEEELDVRAQSRSFDENGVSDGGFGGETSPLEHIPTVHERDDRNSRPPGTNSSNSIVAELSRSLRADHPPALVIDQQNRTARPNSPAKPKKSSPTIRERSAESIRDYIWLFLRQNQNGLAFNLAKCLTQLYPTEETRLPSSLVRAAGLGSLVCSATGEIAQLLREDFEALFKTGLDVEANGSSDDAIFLLLAASALRPALIAPFSGAPGVLRLLQDWSSGPHIRDFCIFMAERGTRVITSGTWVPLDLEQLGGAKDAAAWKADLEALSRQTDAWCTQAPQMTVKYAPATRVWWKWNESDGPISQMLRSVRHGSHDNADDVQTWIQKLGDDRKVDALVEYYDRQVLRRSFANAPIESKALMQLRKLVRTSVSLAERWVSLIQNRPGRPQTITQEWAEEVRVQVSNRQVAIFAELASLTNTTSGTAASLCFRRAFQDIVALFDPQQHSITDEPDPKLLLYSDLLRIPDLYSGEDWAPIFVDEEEAVSDVQHRVDSKHQANLLVDRIIALHDKQPTWESAYQARKHRKDHDGLQKLVECLAANNDPLAEKLAADAQQDLADCRHALRRDLDNTSATLELAGILRLVKEEERAEFKSQLDAIYVNLPRISRFAHEHRRLREMRELIAVRKNAQVDAVRRRISAEGLNRTDPAYEHITSALERGDFTVANELIDSAVKGEAVVFSVETTNTFREFFPERCTQIEEHLKVDKSFRSVRTANRHSFPSSLPKEQAEKAGEVLRRWFDFKDKLATPETSLDAVRDILLFLGFSGVHVSVKQRSRYSWLAFQAIQPSPSTCLVAPFGSDANGRYRIFCAWQQLSVEDLIDEVGDTQQGPPVIVFYFSRLTETGRRALAKASYHRRRTLVVLDDILMVYLASKKAPRLRTFFECTLPFTYLEPYTITPGFVAPEMFRGRIESSNAIIDPKGTRFIYGGRQLGKTALLRKVARDFHDLVDQRIAIFVDLKGLGIGYDQPIEHLWKVLEDHFRQLGVILKPVPTSRPDDILTQISIWLRADVSRRILLLLDEADRFLEIDSRKDYVLVSRLKHLMDESGMQFKVVLSGLHRVQRMARDANNPMLHFHDPISIGPLLDRDRSEAQKLIQEPFGYLGYEFESLDLVFHILSQTNWYPSLIQLYCYRLFQHVATSRTIRTGPPYRIRREDLDELYNDRGLRKDVIDRFQLTVRLDQRYEVIAYALAWDFSRSSGETAVVQARDWQWIYKDVRYWWEEGFPNPDDNDEQRKFVTLLDEMVGLGVLREAGDGHYALRNSNVVSFLGSQEEIESVLQAARELPLEYDANVFRSALRIMDREELQRRSPLTVAQQQLLETPCNGIAVVIGCDASGLGDLPDFLLSAFGREFFLSAEACKSVEEFSVVLGSLNERSKGGITVLWVPNGVPWERSWIDEARRKIERFTSTSSFVRLVFGADGPKTWSLIENGGLAPLQTMDITVVSLRPWEDPAIRQWLEDCDMPQPRNLRALLSNVTGNWQMLLHRFYEASRARSGGWKQSVEEFERQTFQHQNVALLTSMFSLDAMPSDRILHTLAQIDEMCSASELELLLENVARDEVERCLEWARLLGLARNDGSRWQIDAAVARVLQLKHSNV